MVGGSLRVFRLLPPLKLVAMIYNVAEILLKVALNTKNQILSNQLNMNRISGVMVSVLAYTGYSEVDRGFELKSVKPKTEIGIFASPLSMQH